MKTSERQLWKRHIDLLKELGVKRNLSDAEESDIPPVLSEESVGVPDSPPSSELSPSEAVLPPASPSNPSGMTSQSPTPENTETLIPTEPQYPQRNLTPTRQKYVKCECYVCLSLGGEGCGIFIIISTEHALCYLCYSDIPSQCAQ